MGTKNRVGTKTLQRDAYKKKTEVLAKTLQTGTKNRAPLKRYKPVGKILQAAMKNRTVSKNAMSTPKSRGVCKNVTNGVLKTEIFIHLKSVQIGRILH